MHRDAHRPPRLSQSLTYARSSDQRELPPRPSTARSSRSSPKKPPSTRSSRSPSKERSQLSLRDSSSERKAPAESPDEWFRRVIRAKKLSPLDLADVFAFGNARVHDKVPLSHVCEVMFDLDPHVRDGANPVSELMEDLLYEHSYEDKGEIMVDMKAVLRSLDIWDLGQAPPSPSISSPDSVVRPMKDARVREVVLKSKNKRLEEAVSSIQRDNMRLSRELQTAWTSRTGSKSASPTRTDRSQTQFDSNASSPKPSATRKPVEPAGPEEELVMIANELTYSGVKQLELQLVQMDKSATGFVSLKQLRWLLADHFALETSETRLLEMCLGMSFNPQAQLDYKELVTALLDILIYAAPSLPGSKKSDALSRFDKYLASGFPPDRVKARQLIDQLCRRFDSGSDGRIALAELLRVLRCDLVEEHALRLAFPLTEKETIQLILSTSAPPVSSSGEATGAFVYYDEVLDTLFGSINLDDAVCGASEGQVAQALSWRFWERIRKTLCNGSRAKEASVLEQIVKIVHKLDRSKTFAVSPLFFKRIFDQHLRPEDVYVLSRVLQMPEPAGDKTHRDRDTLRYDVFLFMTFGAPPIEQDVRGKHPFAVTVRSKLVRNDRSLRMSIAEVMKTHGADWTLDLDGFCELIGQSADREPLAPLELLFLFATLSDSFEAGRKVQVKALWNLLVRDCWGQPSSSRPSPADERSQQQQPQVSASVDSDTERSSADSIRNLVTEGLNNYNLERALGPYKLKHCGWVAMPKLAAELVQMFRAVGVPDRYKSEKELVRELDMFLSHIDDRADRSERHTDDDMAPFPHAISLNDFFDSVFDWNGVVRALQLPHNLVEVNRQLQVFDWDKNGTILCDDWNKAWRPLCLGQSGMRDWEIRVLQRRFPGTPGASTSLMKAPSTSGGGGSRAPSLWGESINYSRLLVFLLDQHQQRARDGLCRYTIDVIQRETASTAGGISTFRLEKLFRSLDRDNKGFFTARDLVAFLVNRQGTEEDNTLANDGVVMEWLENPDAVSFVMKFLSTGAASSAVSHTQTVAQAASSAQNKPSVVTFDQFRRLVSSFASDFRGRKARHPSDNASPPSHSRQTVVVASLRSLELSLLEIARDVSQANGQIVPLRAFRYLSQQTLVADTHTAYGASESSSPAKSPSRSARREELSSPIKNRQRELRAAPSDPLTPERLKQVLQRRHRLTVSTHLIGQFFAHVGAASKHFLELGEFSRWAAPLAVDMQVRVRAAVRKMIITSKGGGGKVDLDRFLAQLERRLLDSPLYASRPNASYSSSVSGSLRRLPPRVPVSLLLSKLHQLNIPLSRLDATALLRHFGMDDDDEYVDYTLFLQRLYEASLAAQAADQVQAKRV